MMLYLSYPINRNAPLYPGTPETEIELAESIEEGDGSNSSMIIINSHAGTHIDLPLHFCPGKAGVLEMLKPENVFDPAYCIDIPKENDDPVMPQDLMQISAEMRNAEALLIRTGAFRHRETDPDGYAAHHPWVHPDVPPFLREQFPNLRLFGIDAISIAVPHREEEGAAVHQEFLCGSRPIMILEDMDLSSEHLTEGAMKLRVYPIVYDDLDGVPVIALAELP
jgi:arylformamidase